MKKKKKNKNNDDDFLVFYLTTERQGLYLGDKKIKTVEQVQNGVKYYKQLSLFIGDKNE